MFLITEAAKETILVYSQGSAKVLKVICFNII